MNFANLNACNTQCVILKPHDELDLQGDRTLRETIYRLSILSTCHPGAVLLHQFYMFVAPSMGVTSLILYDSWSES